MNTVLNFSAAALTTLVTIFTPSFAWATPEATTVSASSALLESAFAAADRGDSTEAFNGFAAVAAEGPVNGHIYYDLGVTAWQAGRRGEAVAAFLAARRFLPRDPDVAADLTAALSHISDRLDAHVPRTVERTLLAWLEPVTPRELGIVAALLLLTSGIFSIAFFVPRAPRKLRQTSLAAGGLGLLFLVLFGLRLATDETWGAVTSPVTSARTGPGERNTLVFELHEGAPVRLAGAARDGYRLVELSDGKRGWMAATDIGIFGSPKL